MLFENGCNEPENLSDSAKKPKAAPMVMASDNSSSPDGLIWDGDNYSCAYDALLTILYEVWSMWWSGPISI
jgi:hypothetical protein